MEAKNGKGFMRLEIAIYVTTFALVSTSLLLGRKRGRAPTNAAEALHPELDKLVRHTLLFNTTAPVAHC
jgi:hypothetical protein